MKIHAFDIFDVDIGTHWRRTPRSGWMPTSKASVVLNEFNKPNRMIGSHTVIDDLKMLLETEPGDLDASDPYGRLWRSEMCDSFNEKLATAKPPLPQWLEDKFAHVAELNPQVIWEIVYPVRMVGGKPLYSNYFIQRISLEFEHDHELTAAQIIHEEADRL